MVYPEISNLRSLKNWNRRYWLAIAQRLSQRFPNKSIYLVERHIRAGEETRYEEAVQDVFGVSTIFSVLEILK